MLNNFSSQELGHHHREFWKIHPALLCGISLLIGIGVFLFAFSSWILGLWTLYLIYLRKWASFILSFAASIYLFLYSALPLETPLTCSTRFSISSIQRHQTPFQQNLLYRGTLYIKGMALPCSIAVKKTDERPLASSDYCLEGTLIEQEWHQYSFKPTKWTPIPNSWSFAEIRFQIKEKVRSFLHAKLHFPRTATLLSSLATGEIEDRQLRFEFGRLGLQHLLAISGFHFGVLLAFVSFLLDFFLPSRSKWAVMLVCISFYFFFIGPSPTVQRAWLASTLFLGGKLLRRKASPLNLLGAAMMIELFINPLSAANLGFQLSFGSCFGILFLYRLIEGRLQAIFPARPVKEALALPFFSQWIYLLSTAFRRSIGLSLAVNAAILPLLLYHFGRFPYLSLIYNLFVPSLISLTLFGLFVASLTHLAMGSFSDPFFWALDWLCAQILQIIEYPLLCLDYSLYAPEFPSFLLGFHLFILFFIKMLYDWKQKKMTLSFQNHS